MGSGLNLHGWNTTMWGLLLQSGLALVWIAGARRSPPPPSPEVVARWLSAGLVLPIVVTLSRALWPLDPMMRWVRVDRWVLAVQEASVPWGLGLWVLCIGTTLLFVVQEVLPALSSRGAYQRWAQDQDARLDRVADAVKTAFVAAGALRHPDGVLVRRLDTDEPAAMLLGLRRPRVLVSRGLMEAVDDDVLAAVVAHELSHLSRGGNRRLLLIWVLRALQAPSPAALIIFRALVETEELACDALAVRVLGNPAALASALLQTRRPQGPAQGSLDTVRRRGEVAFARRRIRRLLDHQDWSSPGRLAGYGAGLLLFALLWGVA